MFWSCSAGVATLFRVATRVIRVATIVLGVATIRTEIL
jgi:phage shock protein PspC (stress-responsive transcriptional regulator)